MNDETEFIKEVVGATIGWFILVGAIFYIFGIVPKGINIHLAILLISVVIAFSRSR